MKMINFESTENPKFDSQLERLSCNTNMLSKTELESSLGNIGSPICNSIENSRNVSFEGVNAGALAYGLNRLSDSPRIKEVVDNCKAAVSDTKTEVKTKINDYFSNIYENVRRFFSSNDNDAQSLRKLGESSFEEREFGLDKCSEAAKEIFNPGVIENWSKLSTEQRKEIAGVYAKEVADAFELRTYTGIYFEDMDADTAGYNMGDGRIYLSNTLVEAWQSPLSVLNTVTHELRHQYQHEAIRGGHNISEDVREEWRVAEKIYNYNQPYCYDPWGYTYNPLEIDSRYAGETVIRNMTRDMINA